MAVIMLLTHSGYRANCLQCALCCWLWLRWNPTFPRCRCVPSRNNHEYFVLLMQGRGQPAAGCGGSPHGHRLAFHGTRRLAAGQRPCPQGLTWLEYLAAPGLVLQQLAQHSAAAPRPLP